MSARQQFLAAWEREYPTTLKVLRAYPGDHADLRPAEKCRTAQELATVLAMGPVAIRQGVSGEWTMPPNFPEMPGDWDGLLSTFEKECQRAAEAVRTASDADAEAAVPFLVGPQQPGDVPGVDFLWFILADHIHHRGQFSVYSRIAGATVPSIYGPSADEPWM